MKNEIMPKTAYKQWKKKLRKNDTDSARRVIAETLVDKLRKLVHLTYQLNTITDVITENVYIFVNPGEILDCHKKLENKLVKVSASITNMRQWITKATYRDTPKAILEYLELTTYKKFHTFIFALDV